MLAINGIGSKDISLDDFHKILHNLRPGEVRLTIVRTHRDSSGRGSMTPESSRSRSGTGSSTMTNSSGGGLGSCNGLASLMSPAVPLSKQKSKFHIIFHFQFVFFFQNFQSIKGVVLQFVLVIKEAWEFVEINDLMKTCMYETSVNNVYHDVD